MASFDIVSKVDPQLMDNAVNVTAKEITNRYDFRDSKTIISLNKKDMVVSVETEDEMRIKAIEEVLLTRAVKQGLDGRCFDFSKQPYGNGKMLKKDIPVQSGVDKEQAKKIIKIIKEAKLKVEAQVMDDQVRVSGKKIDDLQAAIQSLRTAKLDIPLQFVNMKS